MNLDVLVNDVKTFIDIIRDKFTPYNLTMKMVTIDDVEPFLQKFEELADEVSILETERQRLARDNADAKKYIMAARDEITRLETENKNLLEMIAVLEERNRGQASIILSKEKRYFTDGSNDYVRKYKCTKSGMMYVEIHNHTDELHFDSDGYDYALKA